MRGHSFSSAIESGLEPRDYEQNDIREGEYVGVLDFKIWGKSPCLHCYFTLTNGDKIKLTTFKPRKSSENIYTAQDGAFDFSAEGIEGRSFKLVVGISAKKRVAFRSAEQL
tara:strand:+ start:1300 stop:1632 length:333 start_codon:yes stop_codon:yes gene_type:complete